MLENKFQLKIIKEIEEAYPNAVVFKTDPNYIQGFPDLVILNKYNWAALEVKVRGAKRPNQNYWVDRLNKMSYASFIFPENERRVLDELQSTLRFIRATRLSVR